MSICQVGMDSKPESTNVCIYVPENHPLIKLAAILPWRQLGEMALTDLKKTEKGFWWLGRQLILRIHLAILFYKHVST